MYKLGFMFKEYSTDCLVIMLFFYFLTIQLTMAETIIPDYHATCHYATFPKCYAKFIGRGDNNYCFGSNHTIECICGGEGLRVVLDTKQIFNDTCQEGMDLNTGYLKTCAFELVSSFSAPCVDAAVIVMCDSYNQDCRFDESTYICTVKKNITEDCRPESDVFRKKFFTPTMDLANNQCKLAAKPADNLAHSHNSAASFDFIWTFLLQALIVLFAYRLSSLTI